MAENYVTDTHGPTQLSGSYADQIASDGTNKHVIRTISVVNTAGTATRTLYISKGAGGATTLLMQRAVPVNSDLQINVFWNLPTSTAMQAKQDTGTDLTLTLHGFHVT